MRQPKSEFQCSIEGRLQQMNRKQLEHILASNELSAASDHLLNDRELRAEIVTLIITNKIPSHAII